MTNKLLLLENRKQHAINAQPYASRQYTCELKFWCYIVGLPVAGMLALVLFLALGGVFALVGPWAILVATRILVKRLDLENRS